jgi:hypothetical protein
MIRIVIFSLITLFSFSSSNGNAQVQYRDKVAIIVTPVTFINSTLSPEKIAAEQKLRSGATYLMLVRYFEANKSFQVLSRDQTDFSVEAVAKINSKRGKDNSFWVGYTQKMKEKSKGIGANWLIMVDEFDHWKGAVQEVYYQFKFLQVQTNQLIVHTIRLENSIDTTKTTIDQIKKTAHLQVIETLTEVGKELDKIWGIIWSPSKIQGKNISASANLPTTADIGDEVLWFQWVQHVVGGETYYEIIKHGSSKLAQQNADGTIGIKSKNNLASLDPKSLLGKFYDEISLANTGKTLVSYLELEEEDLADGYIRFDINSGVYQAIKENREFYLVQLGEKDHVYGEKNLQKDEEYMFGSSVSQTSSFKSDHLFLIKDLGSTRQKYHVELKFVNKQSSSVANSVNIECRPNEFVEKTHAFIDGLMMWPCRIKKTEGSKIELWSTIEMEFKDGQKEQLYDWKEIDLGGEIEKIRVPVAIIQFEEKRGQRYFFKTVKILDASYKKVNVSKVLYIGSHE